MNSIHVHSLHILPTGTWKRIGVNITEPAALWVAESSSDFCILELRFVGATVANGVLILREAWEAVKGDVAMVEGD